MVVLESHHGGNPLGGGNGGPNQYLQPDYLSPLPTTLDAKKSPLALLVQTCSQIGADSPSKFDNLSLHQKRKSSLNIESTKTESEFTSRPRSGSGSSSSKSNGHHQSQGGKLSPGRHSAKSDSSTTTTSTLSISGKVSPAKSPSEKSQSLKRPGSSNSTASTNSISGCGSPVPAKMSRVSPPLSNPNNQHQRDREHREHREHQHREHREREKSQSQSDSDSGSVKDKEKASRERRKTPESSGGGSSGSSSSDRDRDRNDKEKSKSTQPAQDPQGANPIIRSGLEVLNGGRLQGTPGFHMGMNPSALSALGYPSPYGHPDMLNPAFRHPFFGQAAPGGHPFLSGYPGGNPYVSYARVKTPSGGEAIVPQLTGAGGSPCKDPYCTGCQFSVPGAAGGYPQLPGSSAGGICPAGCAQCDHQKIPYPFPSLGYPSSLLSQHAALLQHHQQQQQQNANAHAAAAAAQHQQQQRPHVCNWIVGDNYCGKRFSNSEDLLQHLRTHTQNIAAQSGPEAAMAAMAAHQHQQHLAASSLYSSALMNPAAMAALQRGYPTSPPISPYAAAAAAAAGKGVPVPPGYFPPSAYSIYGPRA